MKNFFLLIISFSFLIKADTAYSKSYYLSSQKHRSNEINVVMESHLLQFAIAEQANVTLKTIPRYTYFFNSGFEINFKIGNHCKLFTGLNVKNIGFIHRISDSSRTKHRMYTFGAPFGFKLHSSNNKFIFKAGIDAAVGFNYKWKTCINEKKTKYNEWFSDRTSLFFPSLFAGLSIHGVAVSANYYLNNFFNPLIPTVSNMDVRLLTIGLGLNFDAKMKKSTKPREAS